MTPNRARGGVALRLGGAALAVAAVNGLDLPLTARRLRALAGGEPVLDLRLAYSGEDVRRVLSRLGPAGRSEYLTMLWTVDLVLPALFATALGAAIRAGALARWHRVALAAAAVDYLENAALSGLITAHPAVHPGLVALASLLTIAKFSLYLTALLVALAGALRSRRSRSPENPPGKAHPMNVLLVLAHPDPRSLNHALADAAAAAARRAGHTVTVHDLYAERFDPLLPAPEIPRGAALPPWLERHCADLAAADGIVIVHPNWWGQPPAILTGWIDRVVRPGVAYAFDDGDSGEGVPVGLLRARTAVVLNTSNTPPEREREAFGDPLEAIWERCVFDLCGVTDVRRRTYGVVVTSTPEQRRAWLADAAALVAEAFPAGAGRG